MSDDYMVTFTVAVPKGDNVIGESSALARAQKLVADWSPRVFAEVEYSRTFKEGRRLDLVPDAAAREKFKLESR